MKDEVTRTSELLKEAPNRDYAAPAWTTSRGYQYSDKDITNSYLRNIGRTQLLTAEDEVKLAQRIELGVNARTMLDDDDVLMSKKERKELECLVLDGEKAKAHLTEANLRLVVSVAKKYLGRGLTLLDLVQEGNLGLMKATERFDYTKGFKFSTYAVWWIRQAISRAVAEQSRPIRIPSHLMDQVNKISKLRTDYLADFEREPSVPEIANILGITETRVSELMIMAKDILSLDSPMYSDDDVYLSDVISDPEAIGPGDEMIKESLTRNLSEVLDTLDVREAGVISMRYGLIDGRPRTLDEVGTHYGLSRERIRQIERSTLVKLRHPSRASMLEDYAH